MASLIDQKLLLRKELIAKAATVVPTDEKNGLVIANLYQLLAKAKGPVAGYMASRQEPNIKGLIQKLALDWVYPKVVGTQLKFYRSDLSQMKPGSFGILEPEAHESEQVPTDQISHVLVPGLAFDRRAFRLGRGKGYYDRALTGINGIKIGVCFSEFIVNEDLPREAHDIPMDWLATETFVLKPTY